MLIYVLFSALAFLLTWVTGHRGVFFLDQSAVFDGAYRIYLGQVPYKDVFFPFSPLPLWYQALAFRIFGVSFTSMVITAAILNVLATLIVIRIVRSFFSPHIAFSIIAGLLTAVYFQTPFGTLFFEQVAFFLLLAALLAVIESRTTRSGAPLWALSAIAGLCLFGAILAKQNAGGLGAPIVAAAAITIGLPEWKRMTAQLGWMLAGGVLGFGLFLAWLWIASDPALFKRFTIDVASSIATARIKGNPVETFQKATFSMNSSGARMANMFAFFSGVLMLPLLWTNWRAATEQARILRTGILLAVTLPLYQNVFQTVTSQDPLTGTPFTGLALTCAAICLTMSLSMLPDGLYGGVALSRRDLKAGVWGLTIAFAFLGLSLGFLASWVRTVQGFGPSTRFTERLSQIPRASRVVWGEPTNIGAKTLSAGEFTEVWRILTKINKTFFVFGDATMLYGLVGTTPPQPMLYFDIGHSLRRSDVPDVEERMLIALERNNTAAVVTEVSHFLGNEGEYAEFKRVNQWITDNFTQTYAIGPFRIWERNTAAPTGGAVRKS